MLKDFRLNNYRNVSGGPYSFGRINLLLGPNNSGKSNMMDAIGFLSQMVDSSRERGISVFHKALAARGWNDLLDRRKEDSRTVELDWTFVTDPDRPEPFRYQLSCHLGSSEQVPRGFFIEKEVLGYAEASIKDREPFKFFECHTAKSGVGAFSAKNTKDNRPVRAEFAISPQETVVQQVDALLEHKLFRTSLYPQFQLSTASVRNFFSRYQTYSSTGLSLELMSRAVPLDSASRVLSASADNYVNVVKNLLEDSSTKFLDIYSEHLRELLPELRDLRSFSAGDRMTILKVKLGSQWYGLHELSNGTRKAFLIALLLFSPEQYSVLSLDEPELNLHPAWLRVVGRWMHRFTSSRQLFISTHSPDLLDTFTEGFRSGDVSVFVFSAGEGQSPQKLNPEILRERFEAGWELGDLYRVGEPLVGGWPW